MKPTNSRIGYWTGVILFVAWAVSLFGFVAFDIAWWTPITDDGIGTLRAAGLVVAHVIVPSVAVYLMDQPK